MDPVELALEVGADDLQRLLVGLEVGIGADEGADVGASDDFVGYVEDIEFIEDLQFLRRVVLGALDDLLRNLLVVLGVEGAVRSGVARVRHRCRQGPGGKQQAGGNDAGSRAHGDRLH